MPVFTEFLQCPRRFDGDATEVLTPELRQLLVFIAVFVEGDEHCFREV